uniref:SWIM-type domain-containing protein n=1 Tax=Chenopodium quinoa TaxID=63459 RepID=A0A803M658_CHEQI
MTLEASIAHELCQSARVPETAPFRPKAEHRMDLLRWGKLGLGRRDVLYTRRARIKGDKDIAEFLEAPEKDGITFSTDSESKRVRWKAMRLHIGDEVDIVDSDDEVVSVVDSYDEGPVYPEFNPDTDFKGKIVHRGLQQVFNMRVNQANLMEFEVDDSKDTYVVNLENKACSCNRWTLMGIPCCHALACIQMRILDIEPFIHPTYHVATYTKAYAPSFKAMPDHQQWEVTPYPKPLPHAHRKLPGRPSSKKR